MERDSLHGIDLYKSHIRNTNPIMEPFLSTPNYYTSKGLLKAPPLSLLQSAPFSLQPPQQPPLLPLPRRNSFYPTKTNTRNQKKSTKSSTSKNNNTIPKKDEKKTHPKISMDTVTVTSSSKFGADTPTPPKNIARVGRFDNSVKDVIKDRVDMLLGSVMFAISPPPPSSLPLPTFSMRPKLSCNAAAAGIDAGASNDLRRLLRLQ